MPMERLSMRRIRQVLQLHFGARASARVIAGTVGRSTVQDYWHVRRQPGWLGPRAVRVTVAGFLKFRESGRASGG
jgi:hypothetical protein